MSPLSNELGPLASRANTNTTTPRTLSLLEKVNFTVYLFSRGKMPIDMKMLMFFPGKLMSSDNRKNHGCGQK